MDKPNKSVTPLALALMLIFIVLVPLSPLLISGKWNWWQAWAYAAISIFGFAIGRALAARHNPGLLAERARFMRYENTQAYDRLVAPLVGLGSALIPLAAGLEMRLGLSIPYGLALNMVGLVVLLVGYWLASYALIENRFFSGQMRIQTERGHQVVSSGPYRWMRHPGYIGAILAYLMTPLLLNSGWGFVPAVVISVLMVIRTSLEDRTLQEELDGYREYTGRVRYRLVPGVW
jgi:protein-S-isoprenylcysteine O-methyltransferase Ste14